MICQKFKYDIKKNYDEIVKFQSLIAGIRLQHCRNWMIILQIILEKTNDNIAELTDGIGEIKW